MVDIAARGFSAFENFMPDHRNDIDLDAHHYQVLIVCQFCFDIYICSSVLANLTSGVSYLRGGLGILRRPAGRFHEIWALFNMKKRKTLEVIKIPEYVNPG